MISYQLDRSSTRVDICCRTHDDAFTLNPELSDATVAWNFFACHELPDHGCRECGKSVGPDPVTGHLHLDLKLTPDVVLQLSELRDRVNGGEPMAVFASYLSTGTKKPIVTSMFSCSAIRINALCGEDSSDSSPAILNLALDVVSYDLLRPTSHFAYMPKR